MTATVTPANDAIDAALASLAADPSKRPSRGGERIDARIRSQLAWTEAGGVRTTVGNVMAILSGDHRWRGVIAFDAFTETPILTRQPPQRATDHVKVVPGSPWTPQDSTRTAAWLFDVYRLKVASGLVSEAMLAVAQHGAVHPVCNYLDSLRWDGVARLDEFFPLYCGSDPGDYARGVARLLFLAAVARVRKPGCKVDTLPVLEGTQGGGKSSLILALAGESWFADTPLPIGDKDALQQLRGVWLYEVAELAAFKGRDATRIKSFVSSPVDHYRPSYEPRARTVKRQCVFIGTTNEDHYLQDATGARRFWPIKIRRVDLDAVRRDRDQLWSEADRRFTAGEPYWPDAKLDALGAEATDERYEGDPWTEPLQAWLAHPVRREPLSGGGIHEEPIDPADGITMADVLRFGCGIARERQGRPEQRRAVEILRASGWVRGAQRRIDGRRERLWSPSPAPSPSVTGDSTGDAPR